MRRKRRNYQPAFKAKMALTAIKGDKSLAELADQFDLHANQINECRKQLLKSATAVFGSVEHQQTSDDAHIKDLHAKIGELTLENDFLGKALWSLGRARRKKSLQPEHKLPMTQQFKILAFPRSTAY